MASIDHNIVPATIPFRLRLVGAPDGRVDRPTEYAGVFELPGLPPLECRVTIGTREATAGLPGPWCPDPLLPGSVFRWRLVNLATGDEASPVV